MPEEFREQWLLAVNNFKIVQYWVGNGIDYIHAEADTGSKYEVFSTHIWSDWRTRENPTCFITVANPWERVWTTPWESWAYPDYVLEHWGSTRRSRSETHGGDAAAITICVNAVLGHEINDVIERAKEWA
jgi:hypothetical protein